MSNKKKLEACDTMSLLEKCSAIIQRKLLEKLKDPGCFTIPYTIGQHTFGKPLRDLGASINLMPLLIIKKLNLGDLKPTTLSLQMADRSLTYLSLQMADRSLTYHRGIIEDVLVKVDKFIFPMDFVALDMEENKEVPLILGRPFLATGQAFIDVKNGELTLRVGGV